MKTIEELEKENEDLKKENENLKLRISSETAASNMWWEKSNDIENKLKALKDLIKVI